MPVHIFVARWIAPAEIRPLPFTQGCALGQGAQGCVLQSYAPRPRVRPSVECVVGVRAGAVLVRDG